MMKASVFYCTAWPDFSACTITGCAQGDRITLGAMPVVSADVFETSLYFSLK
ncbi:MAG TPA: hypothetical protein VJN18_13505 [Polyangiaceae bacterium]|nr:hypothetical protein [Polyangiaceae bacterium]